MSKTRAKGRVWKFGDNINGDEQILDFSAVRDHSKAFDEFELKEFCFAGIRPEFRSEVQPGDIVVGGRVFAKPAHDQVVVAMKGCGISVILCESCEARFIRKGYNIGVAIMVVPGITDLVDDGDILDVDLQAGILTNVNNSTTLQTAPVPQRMIDMLTCGGVIPYLAAQMSDKSQSRE